MENKLLQFIDLLVEESKLRGITPRSIRLDAITLNQLTNSIKLLANKSIEDTTLYITHYKGLELLDVRESWENKIYIEIE
jgi:hypothetical protein